MVHHGLRAKVGDFGVAIETEGSSMEASTKAGTLHYMAPELIISKNYYYSAGSK